MGNTVGSFALHVLTAALLFGRSAFAQWSPPLHPGYGLGVDFQLSEMGTSDCPEGTEYVMSIDMCRALYDENQYEAIQTFTAGPGLGEGYGPGCNRYSNGAWFVNPDTTGDTAAAGYNTMQSICLINDRAPARCDPSLITTPVDGALGTLCDGSDGHPLGGVASGMVCDLTCNADMQNPSDQPTCVDGVWTSTTATCSEYPTPFVWMLSPIPENPALPTRTNCPPGYEMVFDEQLCRAIAAQADALFWQAGTWPE
jgi:hypothetical protein